MKTKKYQVTITISEVYDVVLCPNPLTVSRSFFIQIIKTTVEDNEIEAFEQPKV